jgi:threonine dehydratase
MSDGLPTAADVRAAADRLAGHAVRTPLLRSPVLDADVGATVLLKPESLQRTGSFKFRGAWNKLSQLDPAARTRGVVAYSSGNHAQGTAAAAARLGMSATIVMPSDAPAIKRANTEALGARVVEYDRQRESRETIAAAIAAETGATLVPAYDDPDIVAGQGTVGLEIAEDARRLGLEPDLALVCCGGGGLVAGAGLALIDAFPAIRVVSVEPAHLDDHARSLAAGRRVANDPAARSICDALLAPEPGELTWRLNARQLAGGIAVGDDDTRAAMRYAFERLKLVLEPGGAVALAALLAGRVDCRGRLVAVVLSGGNVDAATFHACLGGAPALR